ncbi:hypothetical protein BJY00DRAFT_314604 [Aspergillus carlsbadensis]|nr:hypothetical protein BJY00DRAFT_314604 [Aspergillus carlsbadensis]
MRRIISLWAWLVLGLRWRLQGCIQPRGALVQFDNVITISGEDSLPEALVSLGAEPRLSVLGEAPNSSLWSVWRKTADAEFVFLLNEDEETLSTFTLSFESPVGTYRRSENGVTLDVPLAGDQTTIFVFQSPCNDNEDEPNPTAYVRDSEAATISLSTGAETEIKPLDNPFPPIEIRPWSLTLESWVPDSDPSNTYSVVEIFELGEQETLVPWIEIPAVQNASGVGIYTTTFVLPQSLHHEPEPYRADNPSSATSSEASALLFNFGVTPSLIRGWLNDRLLPPLDITRPEILLPVHSEYLVGGENTIRVEVSSNLLNAVMVRIDDLLTGGGNVLFPGLYDDIPSQEYGLGGQLNITMLRAVEIRM